MPAAHKGAISFGLVHIPVALHTATQDNDIHFNQLCKEDMSRVRYKKVCASCGQEVGTKDIIKGFEYEDGKYVTVSDEEFEKIKTEKDNSIQILHFTDLAAIRPIDYDKPYPWTGPSSRNSITTSIRRGCGSSSSRRFRGGKLWYPPPKSRPMSST